MSVSPAKEPVFREFMLRCMVDQSRSSAEVIQLLACVMEIYKDMPARDRAGVVAWFSETYGA